MNVSPYILFVYCIQFCRENHIIHKDEWVFSLSVTLGFPLQTFFTSLYTPFSFHVLCYASVLMLCMSMVSFRYKYFHCENQVFECARFSASYRTKFDIAHYPIFRVDIVVASASTLSFYISFFLILFEYPEVKFLKKSDYLFFYFG